VQVSTVKSIAGNLNCDIDNAAVKGRKKENRLCASVHEEPI
jgi:hypothetical protein